MAARGRRRIRRSNSSSSSSSASSTSSESSSCSYGTKRRSKSTGRGADGNVIEPEELNYGWKLHVALKCGEQTKMGITRVRLSDIGIHMKENIHQREQQLCTVVANLVIDKQFASRVVSREFDNPIVLAKSSWRASGNTNKSVGSNLTVSKRTPWLSHHHICSIIVGNHGEKVYLKANYASKKSVPHKRAANKRDGDWSMSLARPYTCEGASEKIAVKMLEANLKLLDPTDGEPEPCRRLCSVTCTFSISQQCRRTNRNSPARKAPRKQRSVESFERVTSCSKTWQGEALENLVGVDTETNDDSCRLLCTVSITSDGSAIQVNAPMAPQGEQRRTTKKLTESLLQDRSVWSQLTTRDLIHMYNRKIQVDEANDSWSRLPTESRSSRAVKFASAVVRQRRGTSMDASMLKTKHRNTLPAHIRNGLSMDKTAHSLWKKTRSSWQKLAQMSRLDPQLTTSLVSEYGSYGGSIDYGMPSVSKRSIGSKFSGGSVGVYKGGVKKRRKKSTATSVSRKRKQPTRKRKNRRKY